MGKKSGRTIRLSGRIIRLMAETIGLMGRTIRLMAETIRLMGRIIRLMADFEKLKIKNWELKGLNLIKIKIKSYDKRRNCFL